MIDTVSAIALTLFIFLSIVVLGGFVAKRFPGSRQPEGDIETPAEERDRKNATSSFIGFDL